ncbi:hypothetical protein [Rhizobium phaseoli]|uniref:hypothetical protein n=1 Tax=Rhizobium phaseoli TaxID=396 RepID=UPI0007E9D3E5|nr:hypothetical protein [Rhizobium phaseoli]
MIQITSATKLARMPSMIDPVEERSAAPIVARLTIATPTKTVAKGKASRNGSAGELHGESSTDKISNISSATEKQAGQKPAGCHSNRPEPPIDHQKQAGQTENSITGNGQIPCRERCDSAWSDEG